MDPLSVIASISGILAVAFKISNAASGLISSWKDAPNSLHSIVSEMAALSACLAQLRPFLSRREIAPKSRMTAISVEQIVIIASSCVLAVSELQETLDSLEPEKPLSKRVKLRWSSHEKKINMLRSRVQASASSLNLVLTVLTCSTAEESHLSVCRLERTLSEVLQKDPDLARRISNIDSNFDSSHYVPSNNRSILDISENTELPTGQDGIKTSIKSSSDSPATPPFGLDYAVERSLASSFVYIRADSRMLTSVLSSNSSAGSGCGWSFLSGISLAQVSNLSVISLPVSLHGLWRSEQYKPLNDTEAYAYIIATRNTETQRIKSQTLQTSRSKAEVQPTLFKPLLSGNPIFRSQASSQAFRDRAVSDSIDRYLIREQARSSESIKILLLGGSEAGKSTILKMMRLVWGEGFKAEERSQFRSVIQSNILMGCKMMLEHFHELGLEFHNPQSRRYEDIINQIELPIGTLQQSLDCVRAWESLWKEDGIQKSYSVGNEYALHDNFANSSEDLIRLLSPDLVPTDADILHARLRTTGITETLFQADTKTFQIFDHGGARSERKKWIHTFADNKCLLFVAPLSGYNQCLIEDKLGNQLEEALLLFKSLLSMTWFKRSPIFLVLNKLDLLLEKIDSHPITEYWPEYEGSHNDSNSILTFIKNKFLELADVAGRSIKVYPCNLTDIDSARIILDDLNNQPWERYHQTE